MDKFSKQIAEATKMFQSLDNENKAFTLIHCWNILKDEDKWKAKRLELAELEKQPNKKKQKSTKMSRPRDDEATNNEEVPEDVAPQTESKKATGDKEGKRSSQARRWRSLHGGSGQYVGKEGGFRQGDRKSKRGEVQHCTRTREEASVS